MADAVSFNGDVQPQTPVTPAAPQSPKPKRRILLWTLAVLGVLIVAGSVFGFVFYQRIFTTSPAELLPADTLAYISVANYQEGDTQNPWVGLQKLLRNFPLAQDLEITDSANAYRRAISQTLGGTIALEKIPNVGNEITVGLTYLPDSAQKLSLLFTPDRASQVAGLTSEAEAVNSAAAQSLSSADLPGVLVFVPLENPGELLSLLRNISDESKVTIEQVNGNKRIYKMTPKDDLEATRRQYTNVREVYSTLVGQYLVFGLRLEDMQSVTESSSIFGLPNGNESFASVEAYKNVAEEAREEQSLAWYVTQDPFNNPGKLFSFFTSSTQAAEDNAPESYIAGRVVVEDEGIRLHSWYPTLASTEELKPAAHEQNLISKLPDKLLGEWVSLYMEQRDVDGIIGWSMRSDDDDVQGTLQEIGQEMLGLNIETEVLPVLSGRTGFMLAPRYDGNSPHAAMIVESEESETVLREKATKAFAAIETALNEQLAERAQRNRESLERYQELYSGSDIPLPSYLQDLPTTAAAVQRSEEPLGSLFIVNLRVPETGGLYGIQQVSYTVAGNRLVVATDAQAVREVVNALQGQGSQSALLSNASVAEQIERHPSTTTHFTYLYPQGIVGILKWILCGSGGLCQVGDPSTEAIAEMISSHLLVTRTFGTSFTEENRGAAETVFLELKPLTAEQQQKFETAAQQLGIGQDELGETGAGLGGFLEQILGGFFQRSISPEDTFRPGSSSGPGARANDARIKSNIGQFRTLAEVYYDASSASYAGVDRCFEAPSAATCKGSIESSVEALAADLEEAIGGGSDLTVNASASAFCISHSLRSAENSICVDATGQFVESPTARCGAAATQCPQ